MREIELVKQDGVLRVSSVIVAEHFDKGHNYVLRDIRELGCSAEFRAINFEESTFTNARARTYPCYLLTKDGFTMLAMGYTGPVAMQWKERYIAKFNAMQDLLRHESGTVMEKFAEAIKIMESDKSAAGLAGKTLSKWRRIRIEHMSKTAKLLEDAQFTLNFEKKP